MNNYPILDRKIARKSKALKRNLKLSKKIYGKNKPFIGKIFLGSTITKVENDCENKTPILEGIKKQNITGYSGNGFPTYEKLKATKEYQGVKTLIVNAIECEPGLIHDDFLVKTYYQDVKESVKELKKELGLDRCYIAIKKRDEVNTEDDVCKTVYLDFTYPLGEEHKLIKSVLGKDVQKYPVFDGILVLNVQTVYQIGRIHKGTFDGGKFITFGNVCDGESRVLYVNKDETVLQVVKKIYSDNSYPVFAGKGIFQSHKVIDDELVSDAISFICISNLPVPNNDKKCLGCGKCTRNCPQKIDVRSIVRLREANPDENIERFNPEKCIKCGLCLWNCPAKKVIGVYLK